MRSHSINYPLFYDNGSGLRPLSTLDELKPNIKYSIFINVGEYPFTADNLSTSGLHTLLTRLKRKPSEVIISPFQGVPLSFVSETVPSMYERQEVGV